MDILFNSVLGMKEGVFILAVQHLNKEGETATWKKLSKLMQVSIQTAKRIGGILEQRGIITISAGLDELGGTLPNEIYLNEDKLNLILGVEGKNKNE